MVSSRGRLPLCAFAFVVGPCRTPRAPCQRTLAPTTCSLSFVSYDLCSFCALRQLEAGHWLRCAMKRILSVFFMLFFCGSNQPPALTDSFLGWIPAIYKLANNDEALVKYAGLDACTFVWFMWFGLKVSSSVRLSSSSVRLLR